MHKDARIISVAHLPRILLKEDNGKFRWLELECISIDSERPETYMFMRQFLDKPVELISEKNSEKGRIVENGKDLTTELVIHGLAKLALSDEIKTYSTEELGRLKEAAGR